MVGKVVFHLWKCCRIHRSSNTDVLKAHGTDVQAQTVDRGSLFCRFTLPWFNKLVTSNDRYIIKLKMLSLNSYYQTVVAPNNLPFYVSTRHCVCQVHAISTDERMACVYTNNTRVEASVRLSCWTQRTGMNITTMCVSLKLKQSLEKLNVV